MTSEVTARPRELVAAVERAWELFLLRGRQPARPHPDVVWASGWRECERRMVLDCTVPDQQLPFDAKVLAKFRRGDDRERDLVADLSRIGRDAEPAFKVIAQQQRAELRDRKGRVAITGKVDGRLAIEAQRFAPPFEVKTWATTIVERITTFRDVIDGTWTRSGALQMLIYLLAHNEPYGFLLLDRAGMPMLLPVELDDENLDHVEAFLARAERVLDHVEAHTLPDFIDDPAECKRCPFFGTACDPPLSAKPTTVLTDPALELDLERWWTLREPGKEWASLDRRIKDDLRGVESGVAGHFSILGKWQKQSRVEVPPDLKKQFTIADPKGRFLLEIERL